MLDVQTLNTKIVEAAQRLDFNEVIACAELGANINATFDTRTATKVTPLIHLVNNVDSFIVKGTSQRPTTITTNFRGVQTQRTVMSTVTEDVLKEDLFKYVSKMIELNAKVDAKLQTGETPLLLALQQYPLVPTNISFAKKGFLTKLIELLVQNGADLDVADSHHFKNGVMLTALHLAGKDPSKPVERPRAMLFNTINRGLANKKPMPETPYTERDFESTISYEQMKDPVRTPKGHVFERDEIAMWCVNNDTCPCCRENITLGDNGNLTPAEDVKFAIDTFNQTGNLVTKEAAQQHRWKMHGL
ncbi:MAG: U-box domain-containing protein [Candidatus Berkiella sp.]